MDIKPIETRYNGHRFRSRLEARWAVFFDAIGIHYQYELEGYVLPGGGAYLPDFFLPQLSLDVEVKPHRDLPIAQVEKMVRFSGDGGRPLLLLVGPPGSHESFLLSRRTVGDSHEYRVDESQHEDDVLVAFWESVESYGAVDFSTDPVSGALCLRYRTPPPNDEAAFWRATCEAKGARFEHGDTPRVGL